MEAAKITMAQPVFGEFQRMRNCMKFCITSAPNNAMSIQYKKSSGSLNLAAVLSGAVLFLCAFLPFVSVNMYFYKQGVNLIDMEGGWLILVCGIAGILGGLSKNTSIQFYSGISSMLSPHPIPSGLQLQ